MKDFSYLKSSINSKINNSAKFTYEQQLNSLEGCNVEIDKVPGRAIVYNSINEYSDKEYRTLSVPFETEIRRGSYIKYDNEMYLNTNDVDKHGTIYKSCKISKCNEIMVWEGLPAEVADGFPIIMSNDSYGSKQNRSNDFISEVDTKMKIQVQENEHTRRLRLDMRFMFNNSRYDIYRITDITTSTYKGLIIITAAKDVYRIEDDLIKGIAFNPVSNEVEPKKDMDIIGLESVKVGSDYEYKINPIMECIFKTDDTDIAKVVKNVNGTCTIRINEKDEMFILEARNSKDEILASKIIYTTK